VKEHHLYSRTWLLRSGQASFLFSWEVTTWSLVHMNKERSWREDQHGFTRTPWLSVDKHVHQTITNMFSNHFDYASFREGFTIFRVFLVFCVTHYHRYVPCVVVTAPPILSSFITYHWIVKKNTTVGATSKALAEHPRSPPVLVWFQFLSL
jgi:hypothetical protein